MDDRAVSRVLSYTITLAISTVLVAGLLIAGGSFVEDQREQVVTAELEVVGQRIAADVAAADRLVRAGSGPTTVRIDSRLPSTVAGSQYRVRVIGRDGNASLRIEAPAIERRVTVPVSNTTEVTPGNVSGGDLVVAYDDATGRLEVTDG